MARERLTSSLDRFVCGPAKRMTRAPGIAIDFREVRQHRLNHPWIDPGRCMVVEIDGSGLRHVSVAAKNSAGKHSSIVGGQGSTDKLVEQGRSSSPRECIEPRQTAGHFSFSSESNSDTPPPPCYDVPASRQTASWPSRPRGVSLSQPKVALPPRLASSSPRGTECIVPDRSVRNSF